MPGTQLERTSAHKRRFFPFRGVLLQKAATHLGLLWRDPERFGRNLLQFTNPALFEKRLIDVVDTAPIHVRIDPGLHNRPILNVLNLALTPNDMTGGPNTIVNLAVRVARLGVPVRLVTTDRTSIIERSRFHKHLVQLVGGSEVPEVPIITAAEAEQPLSIGSNDLFMATYWSTAQKIKQVLPHLSVQKFFYLLQDFEPGFYPWSSNYALAMETYDMEFWPIFNEALLADYLLAQPVGRFADRTLRERAIIFEPLIDDCIFHPGTRDTTFRAKRLLFYARPNNPRNMFGLGLTALRRATSDPAFRGWEFLSIGSGGSLPELKLAANCTLRPLPWMDYGEYAQLLRTADVLLCPMLSPHTSYPVLEMAASGGLSVTNTFATKTKAALAELSDNIIAGEPTIDGLAAALLTAAGQVTRGRRRLASLNRGSRSGATLDTAAARIAEIFWTEVQSVS